MRVVTLVAAAWDDPVLCRRVAGVLATLAAALLVAVVIARGPPDFSAMPIIAVVRDGEQHPVWAIRLAGAAHQIAADSLRLKPAPAGRVYQLWLSVPGRKARDQLGLLPVSGRKPIAVSPRDARQLRGTGELVVTLEPAGGSPNPEPSGPILFRGSLKGAG
jgi:anti-sigma-K factor RskA